MMSLAGGCHHLPVMHHESYSSATIATASPCHEENPYLHGWLTTHPGMSPRNSSIASSDSPECSTGATGLEFSPFGNAQGIGTVGRTSPPMKRRGTANRKERRRTQSINTAFAELRDRIPNVPADTKLSKIKTLRLATSYIAYLMKLLDNHGQNGEKEAFKVELKKITFKEELTRKNESSEVLKTSESNNGKQTKGRTGWPQHVWALELK
ncbi:hypothetical protein JZ751_005954 [Albula glossodonta]|uniref:BHLH domain-containing protein n=1 Tax=Albula glossodonta TaxID=121402 RepID=A0A8T2PE51_9TELE|nr:hypothetical protein JZ751_005954 [Albula glossodonta]